MPNPDYLSHANHECQTRPHQIATGATQSGSVHRNNGAQAGAPHQPDAPAASALGKKIAALRRAARITQDDLALCVGVTRSAVAQWETGRTGPHALLLPSIALALGVTTDTLLGIVRDPADAPPRLAAAVAKARAEISAALDQILRAAASA